MFLIFGTTDLNNTGGGEKSPPLVRPMKSKFRSPLYLDDDYLYITEAQLQFYINGLENPTKISDIMSGGMVSAKFMDYYEKCVAYNVIWDLSQSFPKSSQMYWDDAVMEFKITFPKTGIVARNLKKHGLRF